MLEAFDVRKTLFYKVTFTVNIPKLRGANLSFLRQLQDQDYSTQFQSNSDQTKLVLKSQILTYLTPLNLLSVHPTKSPLGPKVPSVAFIVSDIVYVTLQPGKMLPTSGSDRRRPSYQYIVC